MSEVVEESERAKTVSVFVGNISSRVEPSDIKKWFAKELLDVTMIDMKSGFAFVHIRDEVIRNGSDNDSSSSNRKLNDRRDRDDGDNDNDRLNDDNDDDDDDDDRRRETSYSESKIENLNKTVREILHGMNRTVLVDGDPPVTVELAKGDRKLIEERRKITLPTRVLFVVGFDAAKTTTDQIRTEFETCGDVICVKKIDNYCFITFNEQVEAENAYQKFNGLEVFGRTLTVEYGKAVAVATERGDLVITKAQMRSGSGGRRRSGNDRSDERPRDGGRPRDSGRPRDGGQPRDSGQPRDGGRPRDGGQPRDGGRPRGRSRSKSRERNYRSRSRDRPRRNDREGPSRYDIDSRYSPMPRESRGHGAWGGEQAYIVYARSEADVPPNAVRLPADANRYSAPPDHRYGPKGGGRSRSRSPPRSNRYEDYRYR